MTWLPVLAIVALEGAGSPMTERMTMADVEQAAVAQSSALAAAKMRAGAGEEQAKSVRGRLLPSVNLSDEWQRWDSQFSPSLLGNSFLARDRTTNTFVAALGQPLLGLLHTSSDHSALVNLAQAAAFDAKTVDANLRDDVRTQYVRMFEARALAGVARAAQTQLAEQGAVAKEKLAAGVVTPADLLRLDVAAANAKQQEIQALAAEQVSRASLLIAIGRQPQDLSISFVEPATPEFGEAIEGDIDPLLAKALAQRTEVRSAALASEAAGATARARGYGLLPDVDLEAGYMHITGQTFVKTDSAFIGLRAGWQIWDWGARWYEQRAARAQASAARSQADDARRRVSFDVAAKVANVRATASALTTGRTTIGSAEEAYRVTTVLLAAGSANTTDLLDAQAALTQARLNFERSRYEYALARMSLQRALGD